MKLGETMKILFWMGGSFDRRTPSEHLLTAMIEALYRRGHTVHVLQKDTGGDKPALPEALTHLGVTTTRIPFAPPKKSNLIARYGADVLYVRKCEAWLRKNRGFDRVFLQSSNVAGFQTAALKKCLPGVPVTFNVQDIFPENAVYIGSFSRKSPAYRMLSALQKRAYGYVNRIITVSEDMKDQLTELGVSSEKVEVVYNWSYQDEPYDRALLDDAAVAPLFDAEKFHVVYAGNIGKVQNVEIVVQAAALLRENTGVRFHIFGDGLYKNKLVELARQLQTDNLEFHPMLDAVHAPALYAAADLNVIPLAENIYRTALPSKTATCLACGRPVAFCFGEASRFGRKLAQLPGISLVASDDAAGLARVILETRDGSCGLECGELFRTEFSKTNNSGRYAEIIESVQ